MRGGPKLEIVQFEQLGLSCEDVTDSEFELLLPQNPNSTTPSTPISAQKQMLGKNESGENQFGVVQLSIMQSKKKEQPTPGHQNAKRQYKQTKALFFPSKANYNHLNQILQNTKQTLDICMYEFTNE